MQTAFTKKNIFALLLLTTFSFVNNEAYGAEYPLNFSPCELSTMDGRGFIDADCANWSQPLDPENPKSEPLELFVAKLKATSPTPLNDPLLIINGGPGGSSIDLLVDLASLNFFQKILNKRDIIVLDQRGTGRSSPLHCDELVDNQLQIENKDVKLLTKKCLAELSFDPKYFSTAAAIKDIEALKTQLGYSAMNIYGVSYGTRVSVEYARLYPGSVRSLILDGVVPPTLALGPDVAINSQRALDNVFTQCEAAPPCKKAFPDLRNQFKQLTKTLKQKPILTEIRKPKSGEITELKLEYEHLALVVRMSLYNPEMRSLLPLLIHRAAFDKDFSGIAASASQLLDQVTQSISNGMHNAVVCTEDVPFYRDEDGLILDSKSTYMGDEFYQGLIDICSVWPEGVSDKNIKQPFVSTIPSLILSGEFDPVTPPGYGELLAKTLKNSMHLIGEGQGHGLITRGCIPGIISDFILDPQIENLETDCIKHIQPVPFFVNSFGPEP